MLTDVHSAILVAVIAAVTMLLRFLPFMIFNGRRQAPRFVLFLGEKLPYAIIGMLIIYCLRNVNFASAGGWLPSFAAAAVVVLLHIWKRNTLLSIVGGTALYMFLVQAVFV